MIYPGAFNPFHPHHRYGMEYFGRIYEMSNGILIPSYNHPEKNDIKNFDNRVKIIETFLEEMPLSFPVEVSQDEKITGSTGRSIINECELREGDKYLFLGIDTVLEKLEQMEDYKKILGLATLMVNDYDGEITKIKGYPNETCIDTKSGGITLPMKKDRIIFDKNPFSGLHSTAIRNDPEKYLYLFPEKTRKLVEKYYVKRD
jgi:nicotinic acid mononucleotide adenylyltransferase